MSCPSLAQPRQAGVAVITSAGLQRDLPAPPYRPARSLRDVVGRDGPGQLVLPQHPCIAAVAAIFCQMTASVDGRPDPTASVVRRFD